MNTINDLYSQVQEFTSVYYLPSQLLVGGFFGALLSGILFWVVS